MTSHFIRKTITWGIVLWLIGYLLGILLFAVVPVHLIGWVITPIGVACTLWVILKKVHAHGMNEYLFTGVSWTIIAIVFDYFFLVQLFHPADGYYKADVYLYYAITCMLPLLVWSFRKSSAK